MSTYTPPTIGREPRIVPTDPTDPAHNGEPLAAVDPGAPLSASDCLMLLDALMRSSTHRLVIVKPDHPQDKYLFEFRRADEFLGATRFYRAMTLQAGITALARAERLKV